MPSDPWKKEPTAVETTAVPESPAWGLRYDVMVLLWAAQWRAQATFRKRRCVFGLQIRRWCLVARRSALSGLFPMLTIDVMNDTVHLKLYE